MKHFFYSATIILIAGACSGTDTTRTEEQISYLPHLGQHDVEMTIVNGEEVMDTIYHSIPPYSLLTQDSIEFTEQDVAGKIHVVNFFFTSCPSICPAMIEQMKRLQGMTEDIEELKFLSHTVDPKRDTLVKLRQYIADRNIDTHNWFFLYGEKEYVYDLGTYGYIINAMEDEKADGGFLHSEYFVLIDRKAHIRGMYDGTVSAEVDQLEKDIRRLLKDEYAN